MADPTKGSSAESPMAEVDRVFADAPAFNQPHVSHPFPSRIDGRSWRERLADLERTNGLWRGVRREEEAATPRTPADGGDARTHNWSPELGQWLPRPSDGDIERWIARARTLPDLLGRAMFILLAEVERWRAREWFETSFINRTAAGTKPSNATFDEAPTIVEQRPAAAAAIAAAIAEMNALRETAASNQRDNIKLVSAIARIRALRDSLEITTSPLGGPEVAGYIDAALRGNGTE